MIVKLFLFPLILTYGLSVQQKHDSIGGIWTVTKIYLGFSPGIPPNEVDRLVGLQMTVSDSLFRFDCKRKGIECLSWESTLPKYKVETVRVDQYFPHFKTSAIDVMIRTETIDIVTVLNPNEKKVVEMIHSGSRLIIPQQGVFIEFHKQ